MYTDAFQASVMMFGMTAILVITFYMLGGFTEANKTLTNSGHRPRVPSSLAAQA